MVGALAVAVFVRLVSTVFLGSSRSSATDHAHDPSPSMRLPMAIIVLVCVLFGVFPFAIAPVLDGAARAWLPLRDLGTAIPSLVPQLWITWMNAGLIAALALGALWFFISVRKRVAPAERPTWDCGYAQPTARVQYTGSSLAEQCVRLFSFALMPSRTKVRLKKPFAESARFEVTVNDAVLDRCVLPLFERVNRATPRFYVFQQGQTYLYVLYVVIITAILFVLGISGVFA